jgi:hypothetical protein
MTVIQFDTWKGRVVKTVKAPLQRVNLMSATLSLWEEDVMLVATEGALAVLACRLPFTASSDRGLKSMKCSCAYLASAPRHIDAATHIDVTWPPNQEEGEIMVVALPPNYLRKEGRLGGNYEWPIVLAVNVKDTGDWTEVEPSIETRVEQASAANERAA